MATAAAPGYSTRFKVVAVAVLALAIAAFVGAYIATSGDDGQVAGSSDIVESQTPAPNSQVPQQSTVGIDLAPGWEGTLVLNGVEIPLDQLTLTPELAQVEYTPGEGKEVEELQTGRNCVSAVVWPIAEGRDAARQIPWCFEVV